jgi:hypothetical protein
MLFAIKYPSLYFESLINYAVVGYIPPGVCIAVDIAKKDAASNRQG